MSSYKQNSEQGKNKAPTGAKIYVSDISYQLSGGTLIHINLLTADSWLLIAERVILE